MNDVVSVIEAAYSGEPDDTAWVRRIAELSKPSLDQGLGVFAGLYDVRAGPMRLDATASLGVDAQVMDAFRAANTMGTPEMMARMYRRGPVCRPGRAQAGLSKRAWRRLWAVAAVERTTGFYDALGVVSGDPNGTGCLLMAPARGEVATSRATLALWTRLAAHLASAVRLRHAPAQHHPVEAVLSPSGRLEHAEPPAQDGEVRAALAEGAVRIDRARGALRRRDPGGAVETWRALVAGQWSLVDHFDHDGRRFLLARRNAPTPAPTLAALTARQRDVVSLAAMGHSNKLIGYELGLTPSAVAMVLARAARLLGVQTRVQLIAAHQRADGQRPSR